MSKLLKNEETLVYIIDDDYKLIYFNDALKKAFPSLKNGDFCYEKLTNNRNQCFNCPFKKIEKKKKIFYNSFCKKWLSIDTADIIYNDIPGHLILANYLDGSENDNIARIISQNSFNMMLEIDLNAEQYYIVSSSNNYGFKEYGNMQELINEVAENIVDSTEYDKFVEFADLSKLKDILLKKSNIKEEFRLKNKFKAYEWVQIQIIPFDLNDCLKAFCFINLINVSLDKVTLNAKKDELTNLYKGSEYLLMVNDYLKKNNSNKHYLIAIDIEHFKIYNEWYGIEKGDEFLKDISKTLQKFDEEHGSFSGYFDNDDFCIIIKKSKHLIEDLDNKIMECVKTHSNEAGFSPLYGIVEYTDSLSLSQLYDRACIAVSHNKGSYSQRICYYTDNMYLEMKKEHVILNDVITGLKNKEVFFYLQPQCNMTTGKIFGAEALVRWKHQDKIISPAYFIPVLEKTGRIVDLDKYLWEEVVKWQKSVIERGLRPVPISVNVSRIDLLYLDVANFFIELIETYDVSPSIIEIEITESAYVDKIENISLIVEKLRNYGFKVLMDDFGSGYSSLNMLKNINIDILKMDMKFLDLSDESDGKGINILESVVGMIKTLNLPIIIEGVETDNQVETLKDMGCQYAQGYHYYRPMPVNEFESIVFEKNNVSYDNIISKKVEQVKIRDLLNENLYSDTLVNNILGAVAFFSVCDNKIEILRVNEMYYRLLGNAYNLDVNYRENIINYFHKDDVPLIYELFKEANDNFLHGSCKDIRYTKGDKIIWLHARAYFLNETPKQKLYYCSFEDITISKEKDLEVKLLNEKLKFTLKLEKIDSWEYDVKTKTLSLFSSNIDELDNFIKDGLKLSNFPHCLLDKNIISSTECMIIEKYINRGIEGYYKDKYVCELPFRINDKTIWLRIIGKPIYDNNEVVLLIGSYKDISEKMRSIQNKNDTINLLDDKARFSIFLNVSQNIIYDTKGIGYYKIFDNLDEKDYDLYIDYLSNNSLYADDADRFNAEIQRKNMIEKYRSGQSFISIEYRILLNNTILWRRLFIYLFEQNNDIYAHMYIMDIDEYKSQQAQMSLTNSKIDEIKCGIIRINKNTREVIEVNEAAVGIFAYKSKEELMRHFCDGICDRVYDGDRNFLLNNQSNLLMPGDNQNIEYRILLDNGEYKYIYANETLIENENHELIIHRTLIDNTERKRIELELIKEGLNKELSELKFSNENKAILIGLNKLFLSTYYCNIIDNTFYIMKRNNLVDKVVNKIKSYDELMTYFLNNCVYNDDKTKFYEAFNRSNIKKNITTKNEHYSFPFRRITDDGYKWIKADIVASNFDFNSNVESVVIGFSDISDEILEKQSYLNQIDYYKDLLFNACKDTYLDVVQINLDDLKVSRIFFEDGNIKEDILKDNWTETRNKLIKHIDLNYQEEMKHALDEKYLKNLAIGFAENYRYKLYINEKKNDYCWLVTTIKITQRNNSKYANLFSINITKDVLELESAKEKSSIDGLTGLLNRRMLDVWCMNSVQKFDSCAVLFVDINDLKKINDTMGHNMGDCIIKTCANAIKTIEDDFIKGYRYGGDEFIIIITNKDEEFVNLIVKVFKNNLKLLSIDKNIPCDVSIGISYFDNNENIYDVILKADQDMYKNKKLLKANKTTKINNTKYSSLISFLDTEYISIYEIDLESDTYELIQNNQGMSVNSTNNGKYSIMSKNMIESTTKEEYIKDRLRISSIEYLKNNLPINNHIVYEYETKVIENATAKVIFHGSVYEGGIPKKVIMANKIGRKIK